MPLLAGSDDYKPLAIAHDRSSGFSSHVVVVSVAAVGVVFSEAKSARGTRSTLRMNQPSAAVAFYCRVELSFPSKYGSGGIKHLRPRKKHEVTSGSRNI